MLEIDLGVKKEFQLANPEKGTNNLGGQRSHFRCLSLKQNDWTTVGSSDLIRVVAKSDYYKCRSIDVKRTSVQEFRNESMGGRVRLATLQATSGELIY